MIHEDFEKLKALLFDKGNIEFNEKEQKCYLKLSRHNYCVFIKELERLEQENKQLKEDFAVLKKSQMISNDILNELEEWLKKERDYYYENYYYSDFNAYGSKLSDVLDKIQELKEKYK